MQHLPTRTGHMVAQLPHVFGHRNTVADSGFGDAGGVGREGVDLID
jgi:hypothetical protein